MSEPQPTQHNEGERVVYERCVCREALDHLQSYFGISSAAREHLMNSRIELLKAIRAVIDERIEHLSTSSQPGTKVAVEVRPSGQWQSSSIGWERPFRAVRAALAAN